MKKILFPLATVLAALVLWRLEWDTAGLPPRLIPDMAAHPASPAAPPAEAIPFSPPAETNTTEGRALFLIHCAPCHGSLGEGQSYTASQPGMPTVGNLANPSQTPEQRRHALLQGQGAMPAFGSRLTPNQAESLFRYILTLSPP